MKIRRPGTSTAVALLAWLCAWPLGLSLFAARDPLQSWWSVPLGLLILLTPLVVAWWAWRSGVDVDSSGLTLKGPFSSRIISWESIDGFAVDRDGVQAILRDQSQVSLRPMQAESLPSVIEVGGQEMAVSTAD